MPEIKNNFTRGIMNKDLDERLIPNGQYKHAENIEVLTGEGGDVGVVKAILGNAKVDDVSLSNENFVCVATVSDDKRNRIIYLISGETKDIIAEYNTQNKSTDLVAVDIKKAQSEGSFLNFGKNLITGINIVDDFLFFTDNRNEPKKINIAIFKQGTVDVDTHTVLVRETINTGIDIDESFVTVIKKKPLTAPRYKITPSTTLDSKTVFEKIFPRFAIRYKYQDGEYSAIGPFTDVAFNPAYKDSYSVNNYYDKQGGYNRAMQNGIDYVTIYDFVPHHMPEDVVQVDLLYKQENSAVVYVVESFVRGQNEFTAPGSTINVFGLDPNTNETFSNGRDDRGAYVINSDKIKSALPENQLLRNFDVVPNKALAQEIVGNRVVYGNYTYGYDIPSTQKPTITAQVEQRSGQNLSAGGVKSVKSQRDYQLGLVYGDKYGRETPVFTSPLANAKTSFSQSIYSNMLSASITSQVPSWVDYYKFYVKETSSEYHNVIVNKAYVPTTYDEFENEEGHIWFALNSFDVNKVDEESHIIFKKIFKPSGNSPFPVENRYKVLAVSQDVPEAIKYKHNTLLDIYNDNNQLADAAGAGLFTDAIARIDFAGQDTIVLSTADLISNYGVELSESLLTENSEKDIYISWKNQNSQKSKKYKVTEVNKLTNEHVLKLANVITDDDAALASSSGTASQQGINLAANLTFVIEKRVEREAEEFSGRFFIKVEPNEATINNLLNISQDQLSDFSISATSFAHYLAVSPNTTNAHHEANVNYNTSYLGSAPDETPDDVVGATFINTQENDWQSLIDNADAESRFLLDGMTFVAQQASPNNYAAFATHGYLSNDVKLNQLNWLGEAYRYNYPTLNLPNVNNPGNQYITGQWVSSIGNTVETENELHPIQHLPSLNGGLTNSQKISNVTNSEYVQRIANGLEPFVTTDDVYVGQGYEATTQESMRRWRRLSDNGVAVTNIVETDETYGAPNTNGKIFMHLSFLGPGKDLHDNTWTDSTGLNTTYINGPNAIGRDMQGIWGGGAFSPSDSFVGYFGEEWQISSQIFERSLGNAVEFEGNYESTPDNTVGLDHFKTRIWVGDDYFPIIPDAPGPNISTAIGYNSEYEELHNRQWDPTFTDQGDPGGSIQAFIDKIVQGAKFRFTEDTSGTEYTILSVTTKKLYNHTPWRSRLVWNGTDVVPGGDSVEEKAQAWAKSWVENGQTASSTVTKANSLKDQIVRFGRANNRRLVYVIELDANPADNPNFNPVAGGSGETDANTPTRIEFVGNTQEIIPGVITSNSAIAEVEPKQQEGLDIYYEASDAIPLRLDPDNVTAFAPIGSRVEFINLPEAVNGQRDLTDSVHIRQINFLQATEELILNLRPASNSDYSFNWFDANGDVIDYSNSLLKIIREDGSYTVAKIITVHDHNVYYEGLGSRVVFKLDRNVDPSLQVGLGWNNCYSFGDGVESNSVRDEFSEMKVSNGARASATIQEDYKEENRKNGLIYSGIYNSNNSVNNTNQFIAAEKITKDLNPTYGSIQKLFARSTDLIALCEDRVLKILANKDALFNADSNTNLVASQNVLGQSMPFVGDYGISKNPESFAFDSFRAYFTDRERGAVLRLSMDGLTPISDAGMQDYFKDNLKNYTKLLGTYDIDKQEYNLTLSQKATENIINNGSFGVGNASSLITIQNQVINNPLLTNGSAVVDSDGSIDTQEILLDNNTLDHEVTLTEHAPVLAGSVVPEVAEVLPVSSTQAFYGTYHDGNSFGGIRMYGWHGNTVEPDYDANDIQSNNPFGVNGAGVNTPLANLKVYGNSIGLNNNGTGGFIWPYGYNGVNASIGGEPVALLFGAANIWYQATPPTNFPAYNVQASAGASPSNADWWYYEDSIVFHKVNGHGGNPNLYLQVPGDPISGSWGTGNVTAAQQSVDGSATRMSVFAGEEIAITLYSSHLGTGNNNNKWKIVICDGDTPVSNSIIYDPGGNGNGPYDSTLANGPELGENGDRLLGHQSTNTCTWPNVSLTGLQTNKWWRAKWKFKNPNVSSSTLENDPDQILNPDNAALVINNLTIRVYKVDDAGDDHQILHYVRIAKSVRLETVGNPGVTAVPYVAPEPSNDIPGWVEVSFGQPQNWTTSSNNPVEDANFTFGAEQIYGPENPGTTVTASNGQTYLTGSDNGVVTYGDPNFLPGTTTLTGSQSITNFNSITAGGGGDSSYIRQNLSPSNYFEFDNWYLVDVFFDENNAGPDEESMLVPSVVPHYDVQIGNSGQSNSDLAPENTAYGKSHLDNHPLYPRGYFGTISGSNTVHNAKAIQFMDTAAAGIKRVIFQFTDQSYQGGLGQDGVAGNGAVDGETYFRLQSYGQDFNFFKINLQNITSTASGGELTSWSAYSYNDFKPVHTLDYWRGYYSTGGFNYQVKLGDAFDITGIPWWISQGLNDPQATNGGYKLKVIIENNDDTGTVEGNGFLRVGNAISSGSFDGIVLLGIDSEGTYEVNFNFDQSSPVIVSSPAGSSAQAVNVASAGIDFVDNTSAGHSNKATFFPSKSVGFTGKITEISVTSETDIISSGASSFDWDFYDFDTSTGLTSLSNLTSIEYSSTNDNLIIDNPTNNIAISQDVDNLVTGSTYVISFDFNFSVYDANENIYVRYYNEGFEGFTDNFNPGDFTNSSGTYSHSFVIGDSVIQTTEDLGYILETIQIVIPNGYIGTIDNINLVEQVTNLGTGTTVVYNEQGKGWTSFREFIPEAGVSCSGNYYTSKSGSLYEHYSSDALYNRWYGESLKQPLIKFVINAEPSIVKSFNSINYEGSRAYILATDASMQQSEYYYDNFYEGNDQLGWVLDSIQTDIATGKVTEFVKKENKYFGAIVGNSNIEFDGSLDASKFNVIGLGNAYSSIVDSSQAQPADINEPSAPTGGQDSETSANTEPVT
jgi:hypothetical protein